MKDKQRLIEAILLSGNCTCEWNSKGEQMKVCPAHADVETNPLAMQHMSFALSQRAKWVTDEWAENLEHPVSA